MTMTFGSLRTNPDFHVSHFLPALKAAVLFLAVALSTIATAQTKRPNILVIFGDDIGQSQISAYTMGLMGYRTPNIDRIAKEGAIFTDAKRVYFELAITAAKRSPSLARPHRQPLR